MTSANISSLPDRTLAAAALVLGYAVIIGFTDNYVRVIAEEGGLWQFHATRSVMAWMILLALMVPMGLRLRPRNLRAVVARSAIHGSGMLIYFGALAFLPVALVEPYLKRMEVGGYDPYRTIITLPAWKRQWVLWRAARKK